MIWLGGKALKSRLTGMGVALALFLLCAVWRHGVPAVSAQDMGGHMQMTTLRPVQTGDRERAEAVRVAALKFADRYKDYRKALADGYTIFLPDTPQKVYHFSSDAAGLKALSQFDPDAPTSLLYEKLPAVAGEAPGYKLIGVMYTAAYRAPETELDKRIPLSVAQWHLHTNLCLPPRGEAADLTAPHSRFGLNGSITTAAACQAAGGRFLPHLFGWMVHVYPYETDPAKVWAAGMDDEHNMEHDSMPGMKM